MKELYSIGETAKLLGITGQTLHYYDKVDLVKPAYISDSGYRYYSANQFQRIDRIKYLQRLGFSLEEIRASIERVEDMLPTLEKKRRELERQRAELSDAIDCVDWYIHYFTYLDRQAPKERVYMLHLPQRFALMVPHYQELSRSAEIRLASLKATPPYSSLLYLRQYGYLLDYEKMKHDLLQPKGYYIFLKNRPEEELPDLIEFPEGDYLCFTLQIQRELPITAWDHTAYLNIFEGRPEPTLILANEFEDNFQQFEHCMYEIQIRM